MWRHVDKGTAEGAVDAMLVHGQGKRSPPGLHCGLSPISHFLVLRMGLMGKGGELRLTVKETKDPINNVRVYP